LKNAINEKNEKKNITKTDQINLYKFQIIKLSFAWGALTQRVVHQIIIILVKLCDRGLCPRRRGKVLP
jgi:hypothetical protein